MECYNVMIRMHVVGGSYLTLFNGITIILINENKIICHYILRYHM